MSRRPGILDTYSRVDSPVHRLAAGWKAASAFLLLIAVLLPPISWWLVAAGALLVIVVTILASRLPLRFLLTRIALFEPFVVVMALALLARPDGVLRFAAVVVRSTLSITIVVLLSATTRLSDLLALMRRMRVPSIVVTLLALMIRYVFIVFEEMESLSRARKSRTFLLSRARRWQLLATVLGQLFVRSTERAERVYAAMTARGWK